MITVEAILKVIGFPLTKKDILTIGILGMRLEYFNDYCLQFGYIFYNKYNEKM